MDYFNLFNLNREPFSNSPDPDFFYQAPGHMACLQQLEIAIRLRRGLNVVVGDVGLGKTTLCRQLIRQLAGSPEIETHLVLDPGFNSAREFLVAMAEFFGIDHGEAHPTEFAIKEGIKQALFRKGTREGKIVTLLVDEGQKIPLHSLEILREFLNYETNASKLLQIVIFAQPEFRATIEAHSNFADRINLLFSLKPMGLRDMHHMIRFRLSRAANPESTAPSSLFTGPALWALYRATRGHPRKIINLCHRIFLAMIIQNKTRADYRLVRGCWARFLPRRPVRPRYGWTALLAAAIFALIYGLNVIPWIQTGISGKTAAPSQASALEGASCQALPLPEERPAAGTRPPNREGDPAGVRNTGASPKAAATVPDSLGPLPLRKGETLSEMIRKVLGTYHPRYLEATLKANPQVNNPRRVQAGEVLTLPAVPVSVRFSGTPLWWIRLAETDTLAGAMERVRSYPHREPVIRVLPYWTDKRGLRFVVYADTLFRNESLARKGMPPILAAGGASVEPFPQWESGTVFFADPLRNCTIR